MYTDFYSEDKCLGSVCMINGKNAYGVFSADLKEIKPVAGEITVDFGKALGLSSLQVFGYEMAVSGIVATFYVGGAQKEDCFINTSNLISECKDCIIKTSDDNFEYVAVLTSYNVIETGVEFFNEVALTFGVIKRFPLITVSFEAGNGIFKNVGNVQSGMRLTIVPKSAISSMIVNGITVKNLEPNYPFIIDGLSGEVKCNGINRFLDTDLIEFPKVKQGDNVITSSANVSIEVSYYPTFIV